MHKTIFLSMICTLGMYMIPAEAASPLTATQMDTVTAGNLLGAIADANALATSDTTVITVTRTRTFATPHVATGHAFAFAYGDLSSVTSATVTPIGNATHVESHTVTTPSGISISQANGVAH